MRYSLLSRFRGALLGSLVGEILGSGSRHSLIFGGLSFTLPETEGDKAVETPLITPQLSDWSQIATSGIKSLINRGRLDVEDWLLHAAKTPPTLALLKKSASSSEAAVATLPVALFFHDNEIKLQQQLQQVATVWQRFEGYEGVLAVGYAIALALTEKLNSATLIPRTISYLGTSQTTLVQQLEQLQTLIEQGTGLDSTVTKLRHEAQRLGQPPLNPFTSIAIAIYCFLTTPEDFRLSVSRAVRSCYQPQITAALTGAIAGAYNSNIGIPVGWRLAANRINIGNERLQLADRLLAVWSGVYEISDVEPFPWAAIAAPRVIGPR